MRIFKEKDLQNEMWEDLLDFESYCQISTLGRFKNKKTNHIYKLGYYSNLYEQFSMLIEGRRITALAHRLVAKQFIPNPEKYPIVNHKNGIKDDNRVCNLEWCTQGQNMKHSFKELGRKPRNMEGTNNTRALLDEKDVLEIRDLFKKGVSQVELAKKYNIKSPAIWKIIHRYTWNHI